MFTRLIKKVKTPPPSEVLGVPVRESGRARRMALRFDHRMDDVVLVWARGTTLRAAEVFVSKHQDWVSRERQKSKSQKKLPPEEKLSLKRKARRVLKERVIDKSRKIGLPPPQKISIRDTKTRWGSCSAKGDVMLSWRLLLMPEAVMDYVVAHEVAHRVHHNHGRKFWALCASLTSDAPAARRWLRHHGAEVMGL